MIQSICVFCGASDDVPQLFKDMAYKFGYDAAKKGYTIVYGGGKTGLMGAVAQGAQDAGGQVVCSHQRRNPKKYIKEYNVFEAK